MGGVALVLWGWAIVGMCLETYGFWVLFSGFFPTVLANLRSIPFLGRVLDVPIFKRVRTTSGCNFVKGISRTSKGGVVCSE